MIGNITSIPHFLASGGSVEVWDDAVPQSRQEDLSKQHRIVVKDAIDILEEDTGKFYYDMFSCWEDDMLVLRHHFDTYLDLLDGIRGNHTAGNNSSDTFHGLMSDSQVDRLIPGFIR